MNTRFLLTNPGNQGFSTTGKMCPGGRFLLFFVLLFVTGVADGARADNIFDAVQRDDATAVTRFINADKSLVDSHFGRWSDTPLHLAARLGRLRLARLLIAGGADVNRERFAHEIALSDAVTENHLDVVRMLLAAGANVNHQDETGWTPLMWAAERDRGEIANALLDAGANINAHRTKADGYTALHIAVLRGFQGVMYTLIKRKADLNAAANDGGTPLHLAAYMGGRWGEARILGAAGADLETRNDKGDTPLHVAARGGVEVLRELLPMGASVRAKNKAGLTPREEAQRVNRADCAEMIRFYDSALREYDRLEAERNSPRYQVRATYAQWKTPETETREVYQSHFESGTVSPEWQGAPGTPSASPLRISKTPVGNLPFLGDFGNQEVRLSLDNLPPHQEISVSFDLYTLRSWDGNNGQYGPDIWTLAVADGPTLLRTTFACADILSQPGLKMQAFPGNFPADFYTMRTGASEVNTLGYSFPLDGKLAPADAIYRLRYTFRHAENKLQLLFAGDTNTTGLIDESWGLANVKVAVGVPGGTPALVKHTAPAPKPAAPKPHAVARPRVVVSRSAPAHKSNLAPTRAASKPKPSPHTSRLHNKIKPPLP